MSDEVDLRPIIGAIERAAAQCDSAQRMLFAAGDYSAGFFEGDAQSLREAATLIGAIAGYRASAQKAGEALQRMSREHEQYVDKAKGWHRRMQKAEAACAAYREGRTHTGGMSLGRALAAAAWGHERDRADRLQAELDQCRADSRVEMLRRECIAICDRQSPPDYAPRNFTEAFKHVAVREIAGAIADVTLPPLAESAARSFVADLPTVEHDGPGGVVTAPTARGGVMPINMKPFREYANRLRDLARTVEDETSTIEELAEAAAAVGLELPIKFANAERIEVGAAVPAREA